MNPLITYEAAMVRIDQLHREADKTRLARTVRTNRRHDARVPSQRRTIWRREPTVGCC